jgi:uncharacterized protein YdcH (DUF465 family)
MADAQLSHDGVTAALLRDDAAFQRLVSEHHALDEELRQLSSLPYPSYEEQLTEAALKKKKLALKDRITAIAREQASPGRSA